MLLVSEDSETCRERHPVSPSRWLDSSVFEGDETGSLREYKHRPQEPYDQYGVRCSADIALPIAYTVKDSLNDQHSGKEES